MTNRISAPGQPLPMPQFLYPSQLFGVDVDVASNLVMLAAGDAIPVPAGSNEYLYDLGSYCVFQYTDPFSGTWQGLGASRSGILVTMSNGVNLRIANLTGCAVGASVPNGGTGYAQSTCTVTASVGGSTWQPVVGGSLSLTTINNPGLNYTVPPLILIPGPPSAAANGVGGVPATAYGILTSGSLSGVSFSNFGAGYTSAQQATVVPSPYDPNIANISNATITLGLNAADAGKILAVFCTNNGAPLATISALTLTAAGAGGSGATITPQVLQTVLSASIVAVGAGWGNVAAPAKVLSVGGFSTASDARAEPSSSLTAYRIRQIEATAAANAGGSITGITFNDTGLFLNPPTAALVPGGTVPTTAASITFATGASQDTVRLQPL